MEDWYWVCSGFYCIRRAGTRSVLDWKIYVDLVLGI